MRTRHAAAVAALALAAPAGAGEGPARTLVGTVGPGDTISLAGKRPVRAGVYRLVLVDRSRRHNFHLVGPGVDVATGVVPRGTTTRTVTLRRGTYAFVCDPHAGAMNGSLKVV